ncbi:hypothetical protein H4Q26_001651 [Puccinia striiformis f. sp. tritici PST-130]|nr:hypothetical protein H4Q26_001651 [Puccinia striiformis f. sp. tritici PST-130]
MLGPRAAKQCKYKYPFKTVKQFLDFCQKLTRWGGLRVLVILGKPEFEILSQSIATEARQQMIFRQFEGLFPMPVYHVPGIHRPGHGRYYIPIWSSVTNESVHRIRHLSPTRSPQQPRPISDRSTPTGDHP